MPLLELFQLFDIIIILMTQISSLLLILSLIVGLKYFDHFELLVENIGGVNQLIFDLV